MGKVCGSMRLLAIPYTVKLMFPCLVAWATYDPFSKTTKESPNK
jgi:hypothetical protein